MIKFSIVIPCYNEEKNIPLNLEAYKNAIGKRTDIELVLVNNGSRDNSQSVMEKLLPQYPFARIVHVPVNQGYGFGILSGLRSCQSEFLAWSHADMQTNPKDVIRAIELMEKEKNPETIFVKGTRFGRPIKDQFITVGMGIFESLLFQSWLYEINAQPNLFHRSFFENLENPPHDFSLDLYVYLMAKQRGMTFKRISVEFPERIHGESSWNTSFVSKYKAIKRTIDYSIGLRKSFFS